MANIEEYAPNSGRVLKEDSTAINMANISGQTIGDDGSKEIVGTSAVTPPTGYYFYAIVPSSDVVVSAFTNTQTNEADLTVIASHPTGLPIYGKFTSITLTSGDAIGYLAKE